MSLCFYTVATKKYNQFVAPFIASVMWSNPGSPVSILVEDPNAFKGLTSLFSPGELSIERIKPQYLRWKSRTGAIRFLTIPEIQAQYTYIADIDILVLEAIEEDHIKHMKVIGQCYSNIVREGQKRLSGLHFVDTVLWYGKLSIKVRDDYCRMVDRREVKSDEDILYRLAKHLHGLPGDGEPIDGIKKAWRPSHGIHLSFNRTIDGNPSWGITPLRVEQFNEMVQSDIWNKMIPYMEPEYLKKIQQIKEFILK